jgi:RimJ/RimL family protein N-acetyltransferase
MSYINTLFSICKYKILYINSAVDLQKVEQRVQVKLVPITLDNVTFVRSFKGKSDVNKFRRFLNTGELGFYAEVNSEIVGHIWVKHCAQPEKNIRGYIDLLEDEAVIHHIHVASEYRSQHIFQMMLYDAVRHIFSQKNIKRLLADVETGNTASLRGFEKVGFKYLDKELFVIRILRRVVYRRIFYLKI